MEITIEFSAATRDGPAAQSFPTLHRLGLQRAELEVLRRQGGLVCDDRGSCGYWRLRFRFAGRTRAVYLGRQLRLVAEVRGELELLRRERRARRELEEITAAGKRTLRAAKRRLEPVLQQLGLHYHGDALRKIRGGLAVACSRSEPKLRKDDR